MPSHLPGGIANSAIDGLGLFDNSYQSSDHKIEADAPTNNLAGSYNKTLRELLHGRVATLTRERKVRSTQTLEHAMKKYDHSLCERIHDRIYGPLGLISTSPASTFPVSYNKHPNSLLFGVLCRCRPRKPSHFTYDLHDVSNLSSDILNISSPLPLPMLVHYHSISMLSSRQ
jgi:hypothetical protein